MDISRELRAQLVSSMAGKGAHVDFKQATSDFPAHLRGTKAGAEPHTAWQLLEHIRITQADIRNFCENPDYKELNWPDDYWPAQTEPPGEAAWDQSIKAYLDDLKALQELVADPSHSLDKPLEHGSGQTLFREALLVIDHSSYHLGQFVTLRYLLGIWPPRKR